MSAFTDILPGVLLAGAYVAQVADYIMTVKGLDKGYGEVGLINGPVVKKWGKNALAPATFVEALVVTGLAGVFGYFGGLYMGVFAGTFLAAETYNVFRSAKLLKLI